MKKVKEWPTAIELLKANGYDPDKIVAESVSEWGYDEFVLRANGTRAYQAHGPLVTYHEWHSEQFGLDIMDAIWKDEGLS